MADSITPRTNTKLFGHDEVEASLLRDIASGKLAHGIILSGRRGIGKATLAYRLARTLLAGNPDMELPETHPVFSRIAAGSHADLLVIEQEYDEKKEELANDIKIEQAREIPKFLAMTAGESAWRVVIIDSVDAMNISSANAILKILEEPPPRTVLLLISHNIGRLLPTIRSRCRLINLQQLCAQDFRQALRHAMPGLDSEEISALSILSGGSVGTAIELHEKGALELYNETLGLAATAGNFDKPPLLRYCEQFGGGKKTHGNWQLFTRLALLMLERTAKKAIGMDFPAINAEERENLQKMANLHSAEIWAKKWQQAAEQLAITQALHLDYKQVALTFFYSLAREEEFCFG